MVHCAWGDCANDNRYNKPTSKRPRQEFIGTKWIKWPKCLARKAIWIRACGRADFTSPDQVSISHILLDNDNKDTKFQLFFFCSYYSLIDSDILLLTELFIMHILFSFCVPFSDN